MVHMYHFGQQKLPEKTDKVAKIITKVEDA
jgi:hypothetical protein